VPLSVYRVCRSIYTRLDGEGARRVGGRWNSPGTPVVYTTGSVSLAVLENLVHMASQDYPTGYVVVQATIPDSIQISKVELNAEFIEETKQAGDSWLASHRSSVLEVPSFVVPGESNYLLNPLHPEFRQIVISLPIPFHFDVRLFHPLKI
jgi:RES domain-containing protein